MAKRKQEQEQLDIEERLDDFIHYEIVSAIILTVIFVLLLVFYSLLINYNVTNVYVEGNKHYTASEIRHMVEQGRFGDNSLYLSSSESSIIFVSFFAIVPNLLSFTA